MPVTEPEDQLELICWDLGDTLVDEHWLDVAPAGFPAWAERFPAIAQQRSDLWDLWGTGDVRLPQIVSVLADGMPELDAATIEEHLRARSRDLSFYEASWEAVQNARGRVLQACVTVNPDIFTEVIVP